MSSLPTGVWIERLVRYEKVGTFWHNINLGAYTALWHVSRRNPDRNVQRSLDDATGSGSIHVTTVAEHLRQVSVNPDGLEMPRRLEASFAFTYSCFFPAWFYAARVCIARTLCPLPSSRAPPPQSLFFFPLSFLPWDCSVVMIVVLDGYKKRAKRNKNPKYYT